MDGSRNCTLSLDDFSWRLREAVVGSGILRFPTSTLAVFSHVYITCCSDSNLSCSSADNMFAFDFTRYCNRLLIVVEKKITTFFYFILLNWNYWLFFECCNCFTLRLSNLTNFFIVQNAKYATDAVPKVTAVNLYSLTGLSGESLHKTWWYFWSS